MSILLLIILFLVVVYKAYIFVTSKPPNTPPGILRVPIAGCYWSLLWGNYKFPYKTLPYYTKKLKSKVISCYLGNFFVVIANDQKSIKEVLAGEDFDGRLTDIYVLKARAFGKKLGIFFIDGQQWREQRRFALRHMRDFGFGRRQEKLEADIDEEVALLVDMLKDGPINDSEKTILKDGAALFPDILYGVMGNCIWTIMFGQRFDRNELNRLTAFGRAGMMFQRAGDTTGGFIVLYPLLRFFGNMFGYTNIIKGTRGMVDIVKEYLKWEKANYSDENDKGLVDRYLKRMRESDENSTFTEEQLIMTLIDFMFPTITAVPATVVHCLKHVMHNPHVSKKVQEEIERVVGTGRLVTWEDRKSLPYVEATVREAMRIETLVPFGVFHRSVKDTTLCGYSIPENTVVITNLDAMNCDPDLWGDPDVFRPERFLDANGQLASDVSLPFGAGHRLCAGETFARFTLFGLFAVLMQNFDFSFIENEPTGLEDKLPGVIVSPKDTWIGIRARS